MRLWIVIVFAIIAFNLFRAFGSTSSSGPDATTAPAPTATLAAAGGPTVDPNVTAGTVEFGTSQDADCTVTSVASSFTAGTKVWWLAHLGTTLPGNATVVVKLVYSDGVLDRFTGPGDTSTEPWDTLCAGEPIQYFGLGAYRLDVWDATEQVLLSTGAFDLAEDPAHTLVPKPDPVPAITFGTGLGDGCALTGSRFDFAQGAKIWWVAPLWYPEPPPSRVLFVLERDGAEVSRDSIPADRHNGAWDRACAQAPFTHLGPGNYHLVVKDLTQQFEIASGQFRVSP